MDPYLKILLNFIYASGGLILFFLAMIIAMRFGASREEKEYKLDEVKWEALFLDYILGELHLEKISDQLRPMQNYQRFMRFITPYLETLDGREYEAAKDLCREVGLISFYQRKLVYGTSYEKAFAAKYLGLLRCRKSVAERVKLLKSRNKVLVLAAAQGLAVSGEPGTFRPVMKALLGETYFTYEGVTEILSRFGRDICRPISKMLDIYSQGIAGGTSKFLQGGSGSGSQAGRIEGSVFIIIMIDLLGHYQYREALPVLNRLLANADNETIIHIMKAFLRIGQLPEGFDPKPYFSNDDWVIRNFAAQVTALTDNLTSIPGLDRLLTDEQWWVRYHAARALLSLGNEGRQHLELRAEGTDSLASGIAAYILASKEAG